MTTSSRSTHRLRVGALVLAFTYPTAALAGAVTDGSVGAVQTLSGRFEVPQTLGSVKGGNLFHSFASFGVASGESATFTTSSAAIRNVITRVTGGTPSAIYGPLSLQAAAGSQPEFFFINPAGVLFGTGAQIDVPGGFHVSTAQQLKFEDGFVWDTGKPTVSGLSVAAPEAFGFLGRSSPTAVRFTNLDGNGKTGDSPSITLPTGNMLNIAGGDVSFDGTSLRLPAVSVQIAATGTSAADVPLAPSADEAGKALRGAIRLSNSSFSVDGPGVVVLRGDSIDLWQSRIAVNSFDLPADSKAGTLHVRAAGELSIRQSQIVSQTNCDAPSAPISVTTGTLTIEGPDSGLLTGTQGGRGAAGSIDVIVREALTMSNGAVIQSDTRSGGHAGSLSIHAKSAQIDGHGDYTGIVSMTSQHPGDAGDVLVDIEDGLTITNGGVIGSVVSHLGKAGSVVISANTLDISCAPCDSVTGIADLPIIAGNTGLAEGDSGSIDIEIKDSMRLSGDVLVRSDSGLSSGKAGGIRIKANSLEIDGSNGRPSIDTSSINGDADAGSISIVIAKDMTATGKGQITTHTKFSGSAGNIDISVGGNLAINGDIAIGSDSIDFSKNAGNVSVTVGGALALTEGASITSRSQNYSGDAGSVSIKAADLTVRGSADVSSAIMTDAQRGDGKAGDIAIDAGRVTIAAGGLISSSSASAGAGGSVALKVGTLAIDGSGHTPGETGIQSRLTGTGGDAGIIRIDATGELTLLRGAAIASDTAGLGSAGTVNVNVAQLSIDGGDSPGAGKTGIFGSAAAGSSGQTGHLQVHADRAITLRNGGTLSIRNDAKVADPKAVTPTVLNVSATDISLDHADITAEATRNADASHINIAAANRLQLNGSSIRTSAIDGDGGNIRLGGKLIRLSDSVVTTSVGGFTSGNGGNIDIVGNALVLKSGFIQANSLAPLAQGGNITIDTRMLLLDGGKLMIGGSGIQPFVAGGGLSVIQAAAPDGVAGDLQITTPELNLAGTLSGLSSPVVDFGPLARDQCRVGSGSSFTLTGASVAPIPVADVAAVDR